MPSAFERSPSEQCSSTNSALSCSCQTKIAFLDSRRTERSSWTAFGKRPPTKNGLRPRRICLPSVAVLFSFVIPSFLLLLIGTMGGANAMPSEWEEQRMCGRLLIQALKMVCNHQYAQPNRDNFYETAGAALRLRRSSVVKRQRQPLEDGNALIGASQRTMERGRRGIIWECCTNKCSLNYIRNNYCAAPPPQGEQRDENAIAAFQLEDERRRRR